LAPLLVLSPTSLCIYNQQFIAKRVISLKNQLVYRAPLQPVLTFIVSDLRGRLSLGVYCGPGIYPGDYAHLVVSR
jgi:hypothetical protein